jgi:hypothetical protein
MNPMAITQGLNEGAQVGNGLNPPLVLGAPGSPGKGEAFEAAAVTDEARQAATSSAHAAEGGATTADARQASASVTSAAEAGTVEAGARQGET